MGFFQYSAKRHLARRLSRRHGDRV